MITSFVRLDQHCRRCDRHLTVDEHRKARELLEAALVSYNGLASWAATQTPPKVLYKVLPKHHAVTHYYEVPVNPRRVTCYPDEDMVGRTKNIYCKCHGASAPKRSLSRYCVLVCVRWWEALRVLRGIPRAS